jgi:predicted acylesterase/phospholipase RssA
MKIGLALSGGGFRAASFHLGVLKRLEELGVLPRVAVVSTVSGGAIVGAMYALRCATRGDGTPGSYPVEQLIDEMRPHLTRNLRGRALFGRPDHAIRTALSFVLPSISRMPMIVGALDRALFAGSRLSELPSWILINATNLRTGKAWKFYKDRAGDYLAGATDKTAEILVAEAVGASAAYPLLVDPYPFRSRWEDLRADLLDRDRWQRPDGRSATAFSRWRRRYGKPSGEVVFPLVDGGVYDNEGLNGLRGASVTHAILSNASPPENDLSRAGTLQALQQTVDVMHARLGATTRQVAHEMTHGMHPNAARFSLGEIAGEIRQAAQEAPTVAERLLALAARVESAAAVGWPPRGHQFVETAQVLLHSPAVARNESAQYEDTFDVPGEDRGLSEVLVDEAARVRTDLDALEPDVFDLLVAQGYFVADAYLKTGTPDIVRQSSGGRDPKPAWIWARKVIEEANAHSENTASLLRKAGRSARLWGRCETNALKRWLAISACLAGGTLLGAVGTALLLLFRLALSML